MDRYDWYEQNKQMTTYDDFFHWSGSFQLNLISNNWYIMGIKNKVFKNSMFMLLYNDIITQRKMVICHRICKLFFGWQERITYYSDVVRINLTLKRKEQWLNELKAMHISCHAIYRAFLRIGYDGIVICIQNILIDQWPFM